MSAAVIKRQKGPSQDRELEYRKQILRKAAESTLIASFVNLNSSTSSTSKPVHPSYSNQHFSSIPTQPQNGQTQTKKVIIEIDLQGSKSPVSIFVKSIPNSSRRAIKELRIYEDLIPKLFPDPRSSPFPECYLAHENENATLFLEDLTAAGFRKYEFSDTTEFDFHHALLTMKSLASLHAQSYYLGRKLFGGAPLGKSGFAKEFPYLQLNVAEDPIDSRFAKVYGNVFESFIVKLVESESPSLALKLKRKYPDPVSCYRKIRDILENERHANGDLFVVCHGDYRAHNVLFKYAETTGVESVDAVDCRIVDLKNMRWGPLSSDLVNVIFTSFSPTTLDEYEDKLIAYYCDSFESCLKLRYRESGQKFTEKEFSIDDFHIQVEAQYRRMQEFGFLCCVTALSLITSGFSGGLESLSETWVGVSNPERYSVLDSLADAKTCALFSTECLKNENLRTRIMGIVERLDKFKIL